MASNHLSAPSLSEQQAQAFWSKVGIGGESACWPWQRARHWTGYGLVTYNKRQFKAHRIAYWLQTGEWPGEMFVRHTCDNPPCCNPKHLLIGTPAQNTQDAVRRGRHWAASNLGHKLTVADVIDIHWALHAGFTTNHIGALYGITAGLVSHIKTGRAWPDIRPAVPHGKATRKKTGKTPTDFSKYRLLQQADLDQLREWVDAGKSKRSFAIAKGVSEGIVHREYRLRILGEAK